MKNFVQEGRHLTIKAPYDVLTGEVVISGDLHGVAVKNALHNEPITIVTEGVYSLPKIEADQIQLGQRIYWNLSQKMASVDPVGNHLIGVAVGESETGFKKCLVKILDLNSDIPDVQDLKISVPEPVSANDPIMAGNNFVGISLGEATQKGDEVLYSPLGTFDIEKKNIAVEKGDPIYLASDKKATTTATNNTFIGIAAEAAESADPTCKVCLVA